MTCDFHRLPETDGRNREVAGLRRPEIPATEQESRWVPIASCHYATSCTNRFGLPGSSTTWNGAALSTNIR